jgi:outer membrane protein assembly factor BamB
MTAMMLDVRTGKVRWDRTVPGDPTVLDRGSSYIGRTVAIPAYRDLSVLDPATGHRRWRLRDRCDEGVDGTIGTTLILRRQCPETGLLLEGYDAGTGRRRWSKSFASWWPGREHARELPVKVDALDRNRMVVWTLEREAVYDATTGAELGEHRQPIGGDGKIFDAETGYGPCRIHSHRDHHDGICATDPVSGRRLWSFPFPGTDETTQLRSPMAVADGRVYTLTSDHGGEIVDHVDVNDARTGALLARVSPTLPRPDHLYGIQSAAGGALVLNDDLVTASTPHKTVVLGDG